MIIFFLLLSSFLLQPMPGITSLDSAELALLQFLLSSLFVSFLSLDPVKGGSSSLLFFLAGCNLKPHAVHWQFRGDDHPLG